MVSVAVFRHILQNILQYLTKDPDTYTYITEIEKNLEECILGHCRVWRSRTPDGVRGAHFSSVFSSEINQYRVLKYLSLKFCNVLFVPQPVGISRRPR
jgi:hypothetical protein